jgi:hypothetical protein
MTTVGRGAAGIGAVILGAGALAGAVPPVGVAGDAVVSAAAFMEARTAAAILILIIRSR